MAITERERLRLHEYFKGTMGEEQAATLMECLPPAGWGDVATKQDLIREVEATRTDLTREIEGVRKDLTMQIDHLREWAEVKFDGVATKESVAELRGELHRLMRTQLFGFFLATAAALSLLRAFG